MKGHTLIDRRCVPTLSCFIGGPYVDFKKSETLCSYSIFGFVCVRTLSMLPASW